MQLYSIYYSAREFRNKNFNVTRKNVTKKCFSNMIFAGEVIFNEKEKIHRTQFKPVHNKNFSSDKFQKVKIPNVFFFLVQNCIWGKYTELNHGYIIIFIVYCRFI